MPKTFKFGTNVYTFDPKWISDGANPRMIDFADSMAKEIKELNRTQYRNIYGEIKRIQSNYANNASSVYLLRPKIAYACGRATDRIQRQKLQKLRDVFDEAISYVKDKETYNNFCNLMEAILAFHRLYSNKE